MRRVILALTLLTSALYADDSFRLSMPKVRAMSQAYRNLITAMQSDPQLVERFQAEQKKLKETNGRDTLSMTAERMIASEPKVAAAFRNAAITPKEAGMTMETLLGAAFGVAMMEHSKTEAKLPEGFVAENVQFYKQHKAEIESALKELQAAGRTMKLADEDEEEEEDEDEEESDQ